MTDDRQFPDAALTAAAEEDLMLDWLEQVGACETEAEVAALIERLPATEDQRAILRDFRPSRGAALDDRVRDVLGATPGAEERAGEQAREMPRSPAPGRFRRRRVIAAVAAAAAVAGLVLLIPNRTPPPDLPTWTMTARVVGGTMAPSDAAARPALAPGHVLELALEAQSRPRVSVDQRVLLRTSDGLVPVPVISSTVLRLARGELEPLMGGARSGEILVIFGAQGTLPDSESLAKDWADYDTERQEHWRVLIQPFELVDAPAGDDTSGLEVRLGGCREFGPAGCEPSGSPLRVWTNQPAVVEVVGHRLVKLRATADGFVGSVTIPVATSPGGSSPAGQATTAPLPPELIVRSRAGPGIWHAPLAPRANCPTLEKARTLRAAGRSADALAIAIPADSPERCQSHFRSLKARLLNDLGQTDAALAKLTEAAGAHRKAGHRRSELFDRLMLAFLHRQAGELDAAWAQTEACHAIPFDEAEARTRYHQGLIERDRGRLRRARRYLSLSRLAAERLQMNDTLADATSALARIDALSGHPERAIALLQAELKREIPPPPAIQLRACQKAEITHHLGWQLLQRRAQREQNDAKAVLEAALTSYRESPVCARRSGHAGVLLDLAILAMSRGTPDALADAKARVAEADALPGTRSAEFRSWRDDVRAQLLFAEGAGAPAAARAAAAAYEQMAESAPDDRLDLQWRAATGLGRVLRQVDPARAVAALERAEALLDRTLAWIPAGRGIDYLLAHHLRSAAELVALLVSLGRTDEAWLAVRRARRRGLMRAARLARLDHLEGHAYERYRDALDAYHRARGLEAVDPEARALVRAALTAVEEADGGPPIAEAFRAPGTGELMIAWFPGPERWHLFAASSEAVQHHAIEPPDWTDTTALGQALLEPVAAEIRSARRLTLLPMGHTRLVDLHALVFDGTVLGAFRPTLYGLDLPEHTAGAADGVLVISDPRGDLPGARDAADRVGGAVGEHTRLNGAAAHGPAVLAAIPGKKHLYFSGHGALPEDSKPHDSETGDWANSLLLAGGDTLTPADVLLLKAVPDSIMLHACGSARPTPARAETLTVAHAFVIKGSRAVLATSRPVDARHAETVAAAVYQAWSSPRGETAATAWQAVIQSAITPDAPAALRAEWRAFRLLVP